MSSRKDLDSEECTLRLKKSLYSLLTRLRRSSSVQDKSTMTLRTTDKRLKEVMWCLSELNSYPPSLMTEFHRSLTNTKTPKFTGAKKSIRMLELGNTSNPDSTLC
jgi:hypothetical protein